MLKVLERLVEALDLLRLDLGYDVDRVGRPVIGAFKNRHHPTAILNGKYRLSILQLCEVLTHISPMLRLCDLWLISDCIGLGRAALVRLLIVNLLNVVREVCRLGELEAAIAN